jgi:tetratricopeptide (TPR) repeat protein
LTRVPRVPPQDRARGELDRGVARWLDGDEEAAAEHARRARELWPADPLAPFLTAVVEGGALPEPGDAGMEALVAGECARRAGRFDEAARHFDAAGNIRPGVSLTGILFALCALETGERARALESIEGVAHALSTSHFVHATLAMLYADAGRPLDVSRAADAALRLDPRDVEQTLRLAWARFEMGDAASARAALATAREIDAEAAREALARLSVSVGGERVGLAERIAALDREALAAAGVAGAAAVDEAGDSR